MTQRLPGLLHGVQNRAHATGLPEHWARVADVYSAICWLAARHRWMTPAELAVVKQQQAAERANALARALAARDQAGTLLNGGDFADGLAMVDQAVVEAEAPPPDPSALSSMPPLPAPVTAMTSTCTQSKTEAEAEAEAVSGGLRGHPVWVTPRTMTATSSANVSAGSPCGFPWRIRSVVG